MSIQLPVCKGCGLETSSYGALIGSGEIPCDILFLGEYPGNTENITRRAYCGKSGKILDELISKAGLQYFRSFKSYALLCHPSITIGGAFREPKKEEVLKCTTQVMCITKALNPRVVVLMGKIPEKYYVKGFGCTTIKIMSPKVILLTGGKASPYWTKTVHTLEEVHELI